jgi:leucyl-tRNA synthetase
MFIGPWEQGGSWNVSLAGIERFLNDVEDIASRPIINNDRIDPECAVTKAVNRTCQRVHKDYEEFKFNTAVSWLMQLRNVMLDNYKTTPGYSWENARDCLLLMLAPICPHRTEEAWSKTHEGSIHKYPFPARIAIEKPKTYPIVVQVNGKKKLVVEQMDGDDLAAVQQYPEVKEVVADKEVVRVVMVPNKILNFVTKEVRTIDD